MDNFETSSYTQTTRTISIEQPKILSLNLVRVGYYMIQPSGLFQLTFSDGDKYTVILLYVLWTTSNAYHKGMNIQYVLYQEVFKITIYYSRNMHLIYSIETNKFEHTSRFVLRALQ